MEKRTVEKPVVGSINVGPNDIDSDKKIITVDESELSKDESIDEPPKALIDNPAADLSKAGLDVVKTVLLACVSKMTNNGSILPFLSFQSVLVWSLFLFRGDVDGKFVFLIAVFATMAFVLAVIRELKAFLKK